MKAQAKAKQNNQFFVAASILVLAAVGYFALASAQARAEQMDAKRILQDAWMQFEQSASQDPLTQQRIATCIGEQAIANGTFSEYSTFDARDWSSVDTQGVDLGSLAQSLNRTIQQCRNQAGARTYR